MRRFRSSGGASLRRVLRGVQRSEPRDGADPTGDRDRRRRRPRGSVRGQGRDDRETREGFRSHRGRHPCPRLRAGRLHPRDMDQAAREDAEVTEDRIAFGPTIASQGSWSTWIEVVTADDGTPTGHEGTRYSPHDESKHVPRVCFGHFGSEQTRGKQSRLYLEFSGIRRCRLRVG